MNKPKIRFKGFNDDWEQRKLEDYLYVSSQKNKEEKYGKEDVLSVSGDYGIVNQIEFQGRSFAGVSVANYGVVEKGDIVYTKSPLKANPYGIIKTNKGKTGIVSTLYVVYKPNKNTNSEFVQVYFEQDARMNSYMHPLVNKGAKNDMKVSAKNALQGNVIFPKIQEQKQISIYFKTLDHLITLHQRKCDEVKKLKKYMLQNMFPQDGEKVPKIRFEGFTNDWEQRKLEELCNITTGRLDANAMVLDGQYDFYTSGIDVFKIDKAAFEGPAITIAGNGASVGYMHLADGKFNAYQRTYVLTDFSADRQFLNVAIGNMLPDKIQEEVRGSGIPYIVLNMLTDLVIPFPSQKEQATIGAYFEGLDHLITLHQRKCEELKNMKKFMLQNMFV